MYTFNYICFERKEKRFENHRLFLFPFRYNLFIVYGEVLWKRKIVNIQNASLPTCAW